MKTHNTPLHEAAVKQDVEFISLLLEFGADINVRNNKGLRPIDLISSSTNPSKELLLHWMSKWTISTSIFPYPKMKKNLDCSCYMEIEAIYIPYTVLTSRYLL